MTGSKAHRLAAELSSDFGRNVGDTWVLRGCVGFTGGEGTLTEQGVQETAAETEHAQRAPCSCL